MDYSIYRISLDVQEIGSQVWLTAKQGDTARKIYISLTDGENPYAIDDETTPVFTAQKPDGNIIFNDCYVEDNQIVYEITPQTTAVVGRLDCSIRLYGSGNSLLVSAKFTMDVVPDVFTDSDIIESVTEVKTLTSLISEAVTLVDSVNMSLENGDFVPKFSIGTVTTLPAGYNATVEIEGTGAEPILNFGIPQGPEGQAEALIPDTELSSSSTRPVQNKVITEELGKKAYTDDVNEALAGVSLTLQGICQNLENKVPKEENKGLSTNDFTNEEKEKLAGIEAGANKYELGDNAVTTLKIAPGAVTGEKIADGAVSKSLTITLAVANWSNKEQTVTANGVTDSNTVIISPTPENHQAYGEAQIRCTAQGTNSLTFTCEEVPTTEITVNVCCINK